MKVTQIAGDEYRNICERDARYQQICAADLSEFFCLLQVCKMLCRPIIKWDDCQFQQQCFRAIQSLLSQQDQLRIYGRVVYPIPRFGEAALCPLISRKWASSGWSDG